MLSVETQRGGLEVQHVDTEARDAREKLLLVFSSLNWKHFKSHSGAPPPL